MTYERSSKFYAFGVANGKKEHYYFYENKKKKKTKKSKKRKRKKTKKKRKSITAPMTLDFLKRLHKKYPKLLIIWDKAPHHKAKMIQQYIQEHGIKQLWFPTACPDENPIEPSWSTLKKATANDYYQTIKDYKKAVKKQVHKKNPTKMFKYLIA